MLPGDFGYLGQADRAFIPGVTVSGIPETCLTHRPSAECQETVVAGAGALPLLLHWSFPAATSHKESSFICRIQDKHLLHSG